MKKYLLILFAAITLASCNSTGKIGGVEITKFEKTDSLISVGVHVFGKGQLSSNVVTVQYFDIVNSDSTFNGNVLLILKTK